MRILTLAALLCFHQFIFGQYIHQTESFDSLECSKGLDSLKLQLALNKTVITEYELVSYLSRPILLS